MKKKRNMFNELMQGVEDMRLHREGKITLRTHQVDELPPLNIDAKTIQKIRENLNLSQEVFARYLRISANTLRNWEQSRTKPNAQAAALILMVGKHPDTIDRLQSLDNEAA